MKINFFRRGISYSILKENVLRVIDTKVIEKIEATNISVKIIDGQPTFLLEPFQIFFSGGEDSSLPWIYPEYILLMKRDGDVSNGVFIDSIEWNFK